MRPWGELTMLEQRTRALWRLSPWQAAAAACGMVKFLKVVDIGEPIATRLLSAGAERIVVTIGKPRPFEDGNDYYCPFSIEHAGKRSISYAGGMDAVQALQLAMKKIGMDLEHIGRQRGLQISWVADTPGDTGFPSS